jgi:hypothetical protein
MVAPASSGLKEIVQDSWSVVGIEEDDTLVMEAFTELRQADHADRSVQVEAEGEEEDEDKDGEGGQD